MAKKRVLTNNEIEILHSIYGDEVKYVKIKVRKGNTFLFKQGTAFVINNKIHFHEDDYQEDFAEGNNISNMAWLTHEICHVWQYQNLDYDWGDALEEHILYGEKVYEYNADESKKFTDYRFEQQGAIIQDYYWGKFWPNPIQEKLEKIIYSSIYKPETSIEIPSFETASELIAFVTNNGTLKSLELVNESINRTKND